MMTRSGVFGLKESEQGNWGSREDSTTRTARQRLSPSGVSAGQQSNIRWCSGKGLNPILSPLPCNPTPAPRQLTAQQLALALQLLAALSLLALPVWEKGCRNSTLTRLTYSWHAALKSQIKAPSHTARPTAGHGKARQGEMHNQQEAV